MSGDLAVTAYGGCCWCLMVQARDAATSFDVLDACAASHGPKGHLCHDREALRGTRATRGLGVYSNSSRSQLRFSAEGGHDQP